mgnify:CR=1 FL=1
MKLDIACGQNKREGFSRQSPISAQKGFSIIELIIYVAVLSVIAAVFVSSLSQISFGWTRSKVESEVQQNLRFAMENISQSARSASAITFPTVGTSGTSTTMIVNGQTVQYFATTTATSTILQKKVGASAAENITSDIVKVNYLNFKTFENNATTTGNVVKATATTSQFSMTIGYNSDNAQFSYSQSATSTERIKN